MNFFSNNHVSYGYESTCVWKLYACRVSRIFVWMFLNCFCTLKILVKYICHPQIAYIPYICTSIAAVHQIWICIWIHSIDIVIWAYPIIMIDITLFNFFAKFGINILKFLRVIDENMSKRGFVIIKIENTQYFSLRFDYSKWYSSQTKQISNQITKEMF